MVEDSTTEELRERLCRAEQELQRLRRPQSEAREADTLDAQALLDVSPIPTFVIDTSHVVVQWNHALERLSGIPATDIVGTKEHWRAFYDQPRPCLCDLLVDGLVEEVTKWYGAIRDAGATATDVRVTDFFPKIGESGRWLSFTAALVRDGAGRVVGCAETLEDVTDRKRAEEALRESEERFRALVEATPMGIFMLRGGKYLYGNPAGAHMLGYEDPDQLRGLDALDTGPSIATSSDRGWPVSTAE